MCFRCMCGVRVYVIVRTPEFFYMDLLLIVVYELALVMFTVALLRARKRLNPPHIRDRSLRYEAREKDESIAFLRFLWDDYKCEYYLYEVWDL